MSIPQRCVRVHLTSGKVVQFKNVREYVTGFDYFYINIDGKSVYIVERIKVDYVERQTPSGAFKRIFLKKKKDKTTSEELSPEDQEAIAKESEETVEESYGEVISA